MNKLIIIGVAIGLAACAQTMPYAPSGGVITTDEWIDQQIMNANQAAANAAAAPPSPAIASIAKGCTTNETPETCEARQRAEFQASLTPEERQVQQQTRDDRDETNHRARQREADRLYCDMEAQQTYASEARPRSLLNLDANINAMMVRDTCLRMKAVEHD
jgi:hypothetical protein